MEGTFKVEPQTVVFYYVENEVDLRVNYYIDGTETTTTEVRVEEVNRLPVHGEDYINYIVDDGVTEKHYAYFEGEDVRSTTFETDDFSKLPDIGDPSISYTVLDPYTGFISLYVWEEV